MELVGHDSAAMSRHYTHVGKESLAESGGGAAGVMRSPSLTRRECEVLRLVATGMLNKQIAAEFGITVGDGQTASCERVYSCYEAGPCGYWYHRELTKSGAVNYVVAPRPLQNQRSKHQKTDRLDARALLENLESYLRGNRDAMSIVAGSSLSRTTRTQSTPSGGTRSYVSLDTGNRSPCGLVDDGSLWLYHGSWLQIEIVPQTTDL
jgi:Bacterial regulatory proteins, luxR family